MNERHYFEARVNGFNIDFKTRHISFWMWLCPRISFRRGDYTSQQLAETTHMVIPQLHIPEGIMVTERYRRI